MNTVEEKYSYEILFENQEMIAANKPAGLASISESDTAIETLHALLEKKYSQKLFIVHRLDKEVSGIILFARNSRAHKLFNDQFAERKIKKFYAALVHGSINESEGIIKRPIREFGSGRMGVDDKKGKPCETKFKVVRRFKNFTLLELNPSTGRRHQLRVHLYSIGHPIVGDLRYGERSIQDKYSRLMLHAESLEFKMMDGSVKKLTAPLPGLLEEEIKKAAE